MSYKIEKLSNHQWLDAMLRFVTMAEAQAWAHSTLTGWQWRIRYSNDPVNYPQPSAAEAADNGGD